MTITPDLTVFPNNVVQVLYNALLDLDADLNTATVFKRPLRESDPKVAAAVFASSWLPDDESYEIGGLGGSAYRQEPTLQQYVITVQGVVQHMDEVEGLGTHNVLAKMIRDMLLRDPVVGVALQSLSKTDSFGRTERLKRRWLRAQRYLSNEISTQWIYMTTAEFLIETETV